MHEKKNVIRDLLYLIYNYIYMVIIITKFAAYDSYARLGVDNIIQSASYA